MGLVCVVSLNGCVLCAMSSAVSVVVVVVSRSISLLCALLCRGFALYVLLKQGACGFRICVLLFSLTSYTSRYKRCRVTIFFSFRPRERITFCVVPKEVSIIVSPGVMPAVVSVGCHEDVICPSTQVKVLEARTQGLTSPVTLIDAPLPTLLFMLMVLSF